VIDIGESKVLKGEVPHPMDRGIDIRGPAAYVFEQIPQLIFCHPIKW
jgi:hypothetical protein